MKLWIKIILGLAIIGIIAVLFGYFFVYNKPHTDYENAEAEYTLNAPELYNAFVEDKHGADSLYTGKVILIEAPLTKKETADSLVIAVIVFNEGMFGDEGIRCVMLPKFHETIMAYQTGDPIKIKGYCTGYNDTDVILEHCSIIH